QLADRQFVQILSEARRFTAHRAGVAGLDLLAEGDLPQLEQQVIPVRGCKRGDDRRRDGLQVANPLDAAAQHFGYQTPAVLPQLAVAEQGFLVPGHLAKADQLVQPSVLVNVTNRQLHLESTRGSVFHCPPSYVTRSSPLCSISMVCLNRLVDP